MCHLNSCCICEPSLHLTHPFRTSQLHSHCTAKLLVCCSSLSHVRFSSGSTVTLSPKPCSRMHNATIAKVLNICCYSIYRSLTHCIKMHTCKSSVSYNPLGKHSLLTQEGSLGSRHLHGRQHCLPQQRKQLLRGSLLAQSRASKLASAGMQVHTSQRFSRRSEGM